MFTNETILIFGFVCSMGYAYYRHVQYESQVKLNDDLIGIIRKLTSQIEEYKDAMREPGPPKATISCNKPQNP